MRINPSQANTKRVMTSNTSPFFLLNFNSSISFQRTAVSLEHSHFSSGNKSFTYTLKLENTSVTIFPLFFNQYSTTRRLPFLSLQFKHLHNSEWKERMTTIMWGYMMKPAVGVVDMPFNICRWHRSKLDNAIWNSLIMTFVWNAITIRWTNVWKKKNKSNNSWSNINCILFVYKP